MKELLPTVTAPVDDEQKAGDTSGSSPSPAPPLVLSREHLNLEVQIQSQFRLLWAVFQSHSTAEDEVIWPALKEKARSCGGKLKLVSQPEDNHQEVALKPTETAVTNAVPSNPEGDVSGKSPPAGAPANSPGVFEGSAEAVGGRGLPADGVMGAMKLGVGQEREGDGERDRLGFGEAVIVEADYTEDHHEEQRLFGDVQEILKGLRNTRHSLPERVRVVSGLGTKTREMCQHLMTHLDKEEESALPLIKHYFTPQEMETLVGKIMGKRPTELMQTILSMMIKNLPPEEVSTVMGYMRQAVKDTYFEKWLTCGGFRWPIDSASATKKSGGDAPGEGVPSEGGGASAAVRAPSPGASLSLLSGQRHASDSMIGRPEQREGASQRSRLGEPRVVGVPDRGICEERRCPFDERSEDAKATGDYRVEIQAPPDSEQSEESGQRADEKAQNADTSRCSVCSYIGRCPVNEPLSQDEFEAVVKRLSHVGGLTTARKSNMMQIMRNHMYRGRKRPRSGGGSIEAPSVPGNASTAWPSRAAAAGGLASPARHYTSTQPDEEPSSSGLPQPLFTREELAPTYHYHPGVSSGGGPTEDTVCGDGGICKGGEGSDTAAGPTRVGNNSNSSSSNGSEIVLGCPHYKRACKMRAPCCQRLFTCRLCHDQASDHKVDREEIKEMLCMRCGTLQPMHSECRNPRCRRKEAEGKSKDDHRMARYYCSICHLFDDAPGKDIYHCQYCNMCRLGKGLGVDFFHCMKCNACVSLSAPTHTCLSKILETDCPICGNSNFTSTSQVKGLRCGHLMHLPCYKDYIRRADSRDFWYRCPVCRKSMEDMREYFSQMDAVVASQPMPEEYSGWKTKVLCHDCERYTEVPYHFYYLKCGACGSYNTRSEGQAPRAGSGEISPPAHPSAESAASPGGGPSECL